MATGVLLIYCATGQSRPATDRERSEIRTFGAQLVGAARMAAEVARR